MTGDKTKEAPLFISASLRGGRPVDRYIPEAREIVGKLREWFEDSPSSISQLDDIVANLNNKGVIVYYKQPKHSKFTTIHKPLTFSTADDREYKLSLFVNGGGEFLIVCKLMSRESVSVPIPITELYLGCVQDNLYYFGEVEAVGDFCDNRVVRIFELDSSTQQRRYLNIDLANNHLIKDWHPVEDGHPIKDRLSSNELGLREAGENSGRYYALDVVSLTIRELEPD